MPHKNIAPFAVILLSLILLSGCSEKETKFEEMPADKLYKIAQEYYGKKEYDKAAKSFEEVNKQHPYANLALKSQIMGGYCYYLLKKYDEAIEEFKTFNQLHPRHVDVAYSYYMIGLCYYEQIPIVQRDQESAKESINSFEELINKFPTSKYAKDAKFKIVLINEHLAGKEMALGRWYLMKKNQTLSALNHFKFVVDNYPKTNQTPEALYRLVECYTSLGIHTEARAYGAILGHNYPSNDWYKKAYGLLN